MGKIKIFFLTCIISLVNQGCSGMIGSQENIDLTASDSSFNNKVLIDDMLIEESSLSTAESANVASSDVSAAGIEIIFSDEHHKKWDKGVVPYRFLSGTKKITKTLFKKAKREWNKNTNVKLRPYKDSDQDVLIVRDDQSGCWATFGRVVNGASQLNINRDEFRCQYKSVFMHEIGHVLGLSHEHQREDRDKYIKIRRNNIADGSERVFIKFVISDQEKTKYDFLSIMHYPPNNRSKNGKPTMVVRKKYKKYLDRLGEGMLTGQLSKKDKKLINIMYPK